jgi:hypothetical protein
MLLLLLLLSVQISYPAFADPGQKVQPVYEPTQEREVSNIVVAVPRDESLNLSIAFLTYIGMSSKVYVQTTGTTIFNNPAIILTTPVDACDYVAINEKCLNKEPVWKFILFRNEG